jgi:hypothetical protein
MRINILSIFLSLIILSCKSKSPESRSDSSSYNLEPAFHSDITLSNFFKHDLRSIKLSEIADSISYVKLETSNESLIGNIITFQPVENGFLINNSFQSLLMFDKKGKFIWKIENHGRGPHEYEILAPDFGVDNKSKEIILPDRKHLFIYNFKGQFVREVKLPFYINQLYVIDSGLYAVANSNPFDRILAHIININGRIVKEFKNYNTQPKRNELGRLTNLLNGGEIGYYKKSVLLSNKDTIWRLNEDCNLEMMFKINQMFGNVEDRLYSYSFKILNNSLIGFFFLNQPNNALYDFKKDVYYNLPGGPNGGIKDDIDYGPDVILYKGRYGLILETIPASDILKIEVNKIRRGSDLRDIIQSTDINNNPILRIIRLK